MSARWSSGEGRRPARVPYSPGPSDCFGGRPVFVQADVVPTINHALRPLVSLARRSRQNRCVLRLVLPKNRPAASTACMANVNASTADDRFALVTVSSSCRSLVFKGLPFALTILTRHFPGPCSNAVISGPLYCIACRCVFSAGRKGEQRLAANLTKTT